MISRKLFPPFLFVLCCATSQAQEPGKGTSQKSIAVPDLICMSVKEAKEKLRSKGLYIGAIIPSSEIELQNLDEQMIYKQTPASKNSKGTQNYIRKGQLIDFWVVGKESIVDTLKKTVQKIRVAVKHDQQ